MRNDGQQTKVREVAEPVLIGLGYDLIALEMTVEHGRKIVRLYIDRIDPSKGPVGIEDCVAATKELSPTFDVNEVIDGRWELEISSPGINRPLARRADFE